MSDDDERARRWRLVLGGGESDGTEVELDARDLRMDRALEALYDAPGKGGLGQSSPNVARWLGDIRAYFPTPVVQIMQKDALERLNLRRMLMEPELLEMVTPDVNLVATLMALRSVLPERTKDTARQVVRQVVNDLERRLAQPLRQAVSGSLHRASRNRHPRFNEMDWLRTIRANLKHYQPAQHAIIPVERIGYGRRRSQLRDIILCLDQSGSMAASLVYAGVYGAVLASLRTVRTRVIAFDTTVVDLSADLNDPVDVLFGIQLGGGTDINRALAYCQTLVERPSETILVLLSDMFEGGNSEEMLARAATLKAAGVNFIALLALNDRGAPFYNHDIARGLATLEIPTFACTPEQFPELMAAAIKREDIHAWAARAGIVAQRSER